MKLFPEPDEPVAILRLTVAQFSDRFRKLVEQRVRAFRRIAIEGEITGWSPRANGNVYFTLKDDRAVLSCFAFSSEARTFPPVGDGTAVVATGSVTTWERRSEYRLRAFKLEPIGIGALAAKVEELRKRLQSLGLFDERRKRQFPRFPQRVALVSARRGAGAEDFETTIREKAPNVTVYFVETRIQGEGAEIDIAEAIDKASRLDADVVVLLRGGGSYEDRFPFNTEPVVRAIVRSRHPVVTAIGHTGDRHLADEAADAVFKTPTAAAEYIAGSWLEVAARLSRQRERLDRVVDSILTRSVQRCDYVQRQLGHAMLHRIATARRRLFECAARVERQSPRDRLERRRSRLRAAAESLHASMLRAMPRWQRQSDAAAQRLAASRERYFSQHANALALASGRLSSADPQKPLERGYAIVTLDGRALREARQAAAGDRIRALLFRGSISARVEGIQDDE
ncbi:MAG TPA: exodeoxyribonuclease VII large subunit [Candidatus Acidoferrales bacterium]|nr:exodeoxyribonuclease VII large subunit [Candidatus Acidoferrales bacterium]